jgi:hypothetical protein
MKPKIENTIPIPRERGDWTVMDKLKVGDSIAFPICDYLGANHAYAYRAARDGRKYRRKVMGTEVRVWRTL